MIETYYRSDDRHFNLLQGNCIELLSQFDFKFNTIFADPPYFLSNGGISCQSGEVVSVNKGDWDKSHGADEDNLFNRKWLKACRDKLADNGTIWVSGTYHNIFSVANCLAELGFKILNVITWAKTNPPPNISCRYFTHSSEFVIWARKSPKAPHYFNYQLMKEMNDNKQMTDVWHLPAIAPWEKTCTKHPTQKPLGLLTRIITLTQRLMPLFKAAAVVAIFLTLGNAAQESFQTKPTSPAGMAGYNKVEKGASVALGDSAVIDTLKKSGEPAASLNIIK